jgi:Sec-independent protein secretion pathway component TatC
VSSHHPPTGATTEHEIHLPAPSLSPPLLGLGVTILAFGVLFGLPLIIVGFGILLIGLVTWLVDDARAYASAPDEAHH